MVTQELPFPGKRRLMSSVSYKEAGAELQQYRLTERAIISRIKSALHRLNHAYEAIDVMRRSQELLAKFIQLAEVRYTVGKAMQQDIFKAQTQLALMQTRIVRMQQDGDMATSEINALLHRPVDAALARPDHDPPRPLGLTLEQLLASAEDNSPAIAREQNMAEARQMKVSLSRKNFYPDFAVSGGYYYMGSMPDMYQFRFDIKLPAWRSKQQAALAEQVHALQQARHSYEAMAHETRWRVNELYLGAKAAWRLMELYTDSVIPQANLGAQSALASYESGTGESMQVLMNLMTSVEQEERYHEEMLNYFIALVRLEEITGLEIAQ
jgi:outer membrane protein TolC